MCIDAGAKSTIAQDDWQIEQPEICSKTIDKNYRPMARYTCINGTVAVAVYSDGAVLLPEHACECDGGFVMWRRTTRSKNPSKH